VPGAPAQETDESPVDWSIERFDRATAAPEGATVAIENRYGDVRVRLGAGGRVEVHSVAQRHEADPRSARVSSEVRGGEVLVAVAFDDGAARVPEPTWSRRRVDLVVAIPPGSPVRVTTDAGRIEVKGGVGELEAESASGEIRLWIERAATVRGGHGRIEANLLGDRWREPLRLESSSGDVEVLFPPRADVEVRLETSGDLTTDYSLEVERVGERRKRAIARLGAGGARVVLASQSGGLAIRRRIALPAER
jgi:hypothetical protein